MPGISPGLFGPGGIFGTGDEPRRPLPGESFRDRVERRKRGKKAAETRKRRQGKKSKRDRDSEGMLKKLGF